jgi:hypothetical protein
MPFPAVRIGKPHIDAPTGKVVRTDALVTDPELQNTRPIRHDRTLRPLRQVENRAAGIPHIRQFTLGGASVTNLLLDTIHPIGSVARSATTVRIDVDLLFATMGANEPMRTHGSLLIRCCDKTGSAADRLTGSAPE